MHPDQADHTHEKSSAPGDNSCCGSDSRSPGKNNTVYLVLTNVENYVLSSQCEQRQDD